MGRIERKVDDNRIVYVDPNDIHERPGRDGERVSWPPDYTDMTLWCNLIVEKSSRLKNQAHGSDSTDTYYLDYDLTKASYGSEYVTFLEGYDADKYNYLTTSYTDFDFNEIRKKNMIEGLQIESINISVQNFSCPHVTIKFIDVRGAGFFGREEATHSAYGKLTNLEEKDGKSMDNFYSCFVSFPYPRFKLQIKGFYGKPVTYQLTCSNFSGNFNSQTGNFELTVQFIGYEYGVLGDIPFDYVVAAPLTKLGREYWDKQVEIASVNNSNNWLLHNGELPCLLYDFYNKINSEIQQAGDTDINEMLVPDEMDMNLTQADKQIEMMTDILSYSDKLKTKIRDAYGTGYVTEYLTETEEYVIVHSVSPNVTITKDIANLYNALGDAIDEYVDKFGGMELKSALVPNAPLDGYWVPWEESTYRLSPFTEYRNNSDDIGTNIIVSTNGQNISGAIINNASACEQSSIGYFNDTAHETFAITEGLSSKLYENYTNWEWPRTGQNYARYAGIIDFHAITTLFKERILNLRVKLAEYTKNLNDSPKKTIKDLVGFSPYVSNYFKVVMCHMETFAALYNSTVKAIYDQVDAGIRTPANLGIKNIDYQTDVPSSLIKTSNQVPPFPSVYKKYSVEDEVKDTTPDAKDIVASAWIGDFKGALDWQEKELVNDLYNALQRINDSRTDNKSETASTHSNVSSTHFSLFGQDVFKNAPVYAYLNKDNLAFYAGVRSAAIFGVYNSEEIKDEYASKFGAIDALNLINQCVNKNKLNDLIKITSEGTTMADDLYNRVININGGQGDNRGFEFAKIVNDRQPVFVPNGSEKLEYSFMPMNNNTAILPMDNFNKLITGAFGNVYSWENKSFKVKDIGCDSYMYTDSTETFYSKNQGVTNIEQDDVTYQKISEYINTNIFNIFNGYTGNVVNTYFGCLDLLKAYDKFSKGENQVGSMTGDKFVEVTNEYWLMDNYCLDYFPGEREGGKSYKDAGVTDKMMVSSDGTIPSELLDVNTVEATNKFIKDFMSKV